MVDTKICRHCGEEFKLWTGKPGYVDECPICLVEKMQVSQETAISNLQTLLEYIAKHPPFSKADGPWVTIDATRVDLEGRLRKLVDRHGNRLSDATIAKLANAYIAATEQSEGNPLS